MLAALALWFSVLFPAQVHKQAPDSEDDVKISPVLLLW